VACTRKLEVAAGLEPAKTGFADQRLGLFGIATNLVVTTCRPYALPLAYRAPGGANANWPTGRGGHHRGQGLDVALPLCTQREPDRALARGCSLERGCVQVHDGCTDQIVLLKNEKTHLPGVLAMGWNCYLAKFYALAV
jgi:hypothetical protein